MFLERRNSAIYQVAIATVIFSLVKTSCFRAKGLWHFIGGYPVICTRPPADISEQGEKNLTVPFSRGSWESNACRSPTTSFQRFSLKSWKPCVSVPRWRQGFFFLEWKCKGIKRRFRKPNQAKEYIKKDSNRYFVEQFKISKGLGNY